MVEQPTTFKRKSKNPDFKRKLLQTFDDEDVVEMSATKPIADGKQPLLIPKIEK